MVVQASTIIMSATRIAKLRSSRAWRLAAVLTIGLLFTPLFVVLALELLGFSTLPGLYVLAVPGGFLWESGYRGSLIDWGDGWAWLTPPGIAVVYGPILVAISWLLYRLLRGRRDQSR